MNVDNILKWVAVAGISVVSLTALYYFGWYVPHKNQQEQVVACLKAVDAKYRPGAASLTDALMTGKISASDFKTAVAAQNTTWTQAKADCQTNPDSTV